MDALMVMLVIMETYHWTYAEYMDQPVWVVEMIRQKMVIDQKAQEMRNRGGK